MTPDAVLQIEPDTRLARLRGVALALTGLEFDLLACLAAHLGQVVPRETLMAQVFGRSPSAEDRALDVHVSHLRGKLGADRALIVTVRGHGYLLRPRP